MSKATNIFQWLSQLSHQSLAVLAKINNEDMSFGPDNWNQLSELEVKPGEFAMVILLRQSGEEVIESGLAHFDSEWEPLHPRTLEQLNRLKRKVVFADIISEFPTCPITVKTSRNPEDEELEAIFKEALDMNWSISTVNTDMRKQENEIAPLDEMLAWLESQPSEDLKATIYLGEDSMEFSKHNWANITGFGRVADDRANGEVIVNKVEADGTLSVAGLLFTGKWFILAPSSVMADHGSKYPANSKYLPFDELFPNCPV